MSTDDTSPVQHQAQLLAALRARDLTLFSQLLDQTSDVDSSLLEVACRQSDCRQFVQLLLDHGTDPNSLNPVQQETALHVSAELGYHDILQTLLSDPKINVNALNGSDQTALHLAVKKCGEADSKERSEVFRQCVVSLLEWPGDGGGTREALHAVDIFASDWIGNTALHYAAQNRDQETVLMLLLHGSYIGARNHAGEMPVSGIEPGTLETFLNSRLRMPNDDAINFNYEFLVPPVDLSSVMKSNDALSEETQAISMKIESPSPEMDPLVEIRRSSKHRHLLLHPILTSFVQLKWRHTRHFYYYNVMFYLVLVSVTTFVVSQEYQHRHAAPCLSHFTVLCFFKIIAHILLAAGCLLLFVKLLFQVCVGPRDFACRWQSYHQTVLMMLSFVVLVRGWEVSEGGAAASTLFLGWTQVLLLTGKHPVVSVYSHLFAKVAVSFVKYFLWCFLLLVAFSLGFYALYHRSGQLFHTPLTSLLTTVGMFAGGYNTAFLSVDSAVGDVLFVLFAFLLSLVLMNVLTGLAVSHTQAVQRKAELVQLTTKVDVMSDIEMLLLGNPLRVHLKMRRLYLSQNKLAVCLVRSSVYLWLMCSCLRWFRNLHHGAILFPNAEFEHASVVFPYGSKSKVACVYSLEQRVLRLAASIVQGTGGDECQAMFRVFEQRLGAIEAALARSEALQRDILQLLQTPK